MKKSILEFYALAICFMTIACFAITFGLMSYEVIRIVNPEFTINNTVYEKHLDNSNFWNDYLPGCANYVKNTCVEDDKRPSEDILTKRREASYAIEIKSEVRNAKQSFIKMLIIILIDVFVFFPHWKIARRARETAA